jgi:hypothetical protein
MAIPAGSAARARWFASGCASLLGSAERLADTEVSMARQGLRGPATKRAARSVVRGLGRSHGRRRAAPR